MSSVAKILETMEYGPALESDAPAQDWLGKHHRSFGLFIGGEWRPGHGAGFDSINPATGKKLASLAQATAADVDDAVKAARAAQPGWAKLSGHARAKYLYALARLVQKHSRLFAVLETLDNGKPIRESRDIDIPLVARHFYHHAGWAQLLDSEFPDHTPLGVVGQVIPWNFPLLMLAWKIAPALACGNTVVLKPAEDTSLTALLFAEICGEAKLPKGVVNIVTGAGETGRAIVEHPDIDKIAFTGSTEVGRAIRIATAGTGKRLTLELGGKSPFVVFEDADLDAAAEGAVDAIWFNQGQVCCAGSRLLVQESVSERFLAKLRVRMETLRVGDPLDKTTDIGAIISPKQRAQIDAKVKQGVAEGAILFQPKASCPEGCFYPPTLLSNVEPAFTVAQEEIFGPVLVSMSFRTPAEAAALANNTRYGLAASIWSEDINVALDLAPKIKAGVVWVNCTNQFDASAGFGGYRESGFGREGGREGLFEYLKERAVRAPAVPVVATSPNRIWKKAMPSTAPPSCSSAASRRGRMAAIAAPSSRPRGACSAMSVKETARTSATPSRRRAKRKAGPPPPAMPAPRSFIIAPRIFPPACPEFSHRIRAMTGLSKATVAKGMALCVRRLFTYAAWADKFDGAVHNPPLRGVVLAMNEPMGVIGIACPDEAPLLAFTSLWAPAVAMGNRVVIVPSEKHPLAATDFYQVLETSDMPPGVINIVTGSRDGLAQTLAEHHGIDAIWYCGGLAKKIEQAGADDLKRSWVPGALDWFGPDAEGRAFLRRATQVKNVWIPYGA